MRKMFLAAFLVMILFTSLALAQNETQAADPCEGVVCDSPPADSCVGNSVKKYSSTGTCSGGTCSYSSTESPCGTKSETCADGYVAACDNSCSNAACVDCTPDCTGHDTVDKCADVTCEQITNTCADGSTRSCTPSCDPATGVCGTCTPAPCPVPSNVTDKCAGITCPESTINCPDGSTASCQPYCDTSTGLCTSCAPQCPTQEPTHVCGNGICETGEDYTTCHDDCPSPTFDCGNNVCDAGESFRNCPEDCPEEPGYCGDGVCDSNEDKSSCPKDCRELYKDCKMLWWFDDRSDSCNYKEFCGAYMYESLHTFDIKDECERKYSEVHGGCIYIEPTSCPDNRIPTPVYEGDCISGYECREKECPTYPEPVCERGYTVSGGKDEYGCQRPRTCCGNSICEGNENQRNCDKDCVAGGSGGMHCPATKPCPDGSSVTCHVRPDGGCFCGECPIQNLPPGCWQEMDERGFLRVECEKLECPPYEEFEYQKQKCLANDGEIVINRDNRGCEFIDCIFDSKYTPRSPVDFGPTECPPPEEIMRIERKCYDIGSEPRYFFEQGCKFVKCEEQDFEKRKCGLVPGPEREVMERKCGEEGLGVIIDFDEYGCQHIRCGTGDDCPREPPREAFEQCNEEGGELIVKRDPEGCVNFVNCARRGDERDIYVERMERMPEASELLAMAFKLENLKIELDKLAKQADDIADYYDQTGSPEAEKYRRVADMFESMKGKVDEIKNKLSSRLEDLTIDDMMEIKHDIKYLKEVMIKDIVYLMLSTGDDVKSISEKKEGDCGTDGMCFDRAFRVCQQVTFRPEGLRGPIVEVSGLEDDACIMRVTLPEGQGPPPGAISGIEPPFEMICKIKNYALGVRDPDKDIMPYCEGNLKELMKYDKQRPGGTREGVGICGDTICDEYEQQSPEMCPTDCAPLLGIECSPAGTPCPTDPPCCDDAPCYQGVCSSRYVTTSAERVYREEGVYKAEKQYTGPCSGCLDNGICDPGECKDCSDCYNVDFTK